MIRNVPILQCLDREGQGGKKKPMPAGIEGSWAVQFLTKPILHMGKLRPREEKGSVVTGRQDKAEG